MALVLATPRPSPSPPLPPPPPRVRVADPAPGPSPAPVPRARILVGGPPAGSRVVIDVDDGERSGLLARFATPAALFYGCVLSVVQLGLIAEYPGGGPTEARWALVATVAYLPLHLRHLYWAANGLRPPAGVWTLLALAAIVTAALPLVGPHWLPVYAVVVATAVLVLPWPWSLLVAAVVVLAQAPLAQAVDSPLPDASSYYVFTAWLRASSLLLPVWLLGAVRRLDAARRSLADEAVVAERLRIDGELRATVGAALDAIATRGQRAVGMIERPDGAGAVADRDELEREVGALVDGSRRALAQARQLINGYQQPSLAAELASASALLAAAGIATTIEWPSEGVPPAVAAGPDVRAALRAATTTVLHDEGVEECRIRVLRDGTGASAEIRLELVATPPGGAQPPGPAGGSAGNGGGVLA
jgi:two-component system sensor histidine kinase DesK